MHKLKNFDIYAPSYYKLLESLDSSIGQAVCAQDQQDDYLLLLLSQDILVPVGGIYQYGDDCISLASATPNRRNEEFRQSIETSDFYKALCEVLSQGPKTEDELVVSLNPAYKPEMTKSVVSWMENLDFLNIENGKYVISTHGEEPEDESVSDWFQHNNDFVVPIERYSIFEYLRKVNRGSVEMNPDFQRHVVWKLEQKCKFIESVLLNLPLPPIYLKKVTDKNSMLVDGLQRTTAIKDFVDGKYALGGLTTLPELNDHGFSNLDDVRDGLAARLEDRQLDVFVIPPTTPMSVVYDVFNRINTGGTQLTRQEMRNCLLRGRATVMLKEIASDNRFRNSMGHAIKPLRMKDQEAVLRCIAFVTLDYVTDYHNSMDDFLEKAMNIINRMSDTEVQQIKTKSINVFIKTFDVYGDSNFRIPTDYTRGRVNIAVMETIFHSFYNMPEESISDTESLKVAFRQLLNNQTYLNSVRWSTSSTSQVKDRFNTAREVFNLQ